MDYSKTLNLPETEFPMRAGLPEREPEILKYWYDNNIYEKKQKLHEGHKNLFCMTALRMPTDKFTWALLLIKF